MGVAALGMLFNTEVNAQELNKGTPLEVIGNPFSQHNVHMQIGKNKLDWYGSGDVNNDEVINESDVDAIIGSNSDRADVDGNGIPGTNADKSILQDYLSGNINYLPGYWNSLTTKGERVNWLEKMLVIQNMDQYHGQGWFCGDYINQMLIDFHGMSNAGEWNNVRESVGLPELNIEDNARFNLPFYHVSTVNKNGEPHSVGGVLVGENTLEFNDWYPISYTKDTKTIPGDFDLNENEYFKVGMTAYIELDWNPGNFVFTYLPNLINFDLENGNATLAEYREDRMILDNPNDDWVVLSSLNNIQINYKTNLDLAPNTTGSPTITVTNSPLEAELEYEDGDFVSLNSQYPNHHFRFDRTFRGFIYSGGVTNEDYLTHTITVQDTEKPTFTLPQDVTITQEEELTPDNTGVLTNVKDNSNLPVETSFEYIKKSEDQNQIKYDVIWTATDVFGNSETKTQLVTVVKAGVKVNSLEDLLVNYGQNTTPESLEASGFEGIPSAELYNTTATPVFSYKDSANVALNENYPDIHFKIPRTHYATIEVNGQEMKDSTKHYVEVKDMECPDFVVPKDTLITKDHPLTPEYTGEPTNITDNSPYIVNTNVEYNLVEDGEEEKIYDAVWTAIDVMGNEKVDTQKVVVDQLTAIAQKDNLPNEFSLSQNYPNPFNPSTIINYTIPQNSFVSLKIYNVLGNEVTILIDEEKSIGNYSIEFNGSNLSSGIYFYRFTAGSFVETKQMLILK